MSEKSSVGHSGDSVQVVTEHREGCHAAFVGSDCACPVTCVMLSMAQLRVLYEAAVSYDHCLSADQFPPWASAIARLLDGGNS